MGRAVALPLAAGTLLTETDLGPGADPPSGQAVVGLALKPGQYPPEVTAGDRVLVVTNPSSTDDVGSRRPVPPTREPPSSCPRSPPPSSACSRLPRPPRTAPWWRSNWRRATAPTVATAASAGDIALVSSRPGRPRERRGAGLGQGIARRHHRRPWPWPRGGHDRSSCSRPTRPGAISPCGSDSPRIRVWSGLAAALRRHSQADLLEHYAQESSSGDPGRARSRRCPPERGVGVAVGRTPGAPLTVRGRTCCSTWGAWTTPRRHGRWPRRRTLSSGSVGPSWATWPTCRPPWSTGAGRGPAVSIVLSGAGPYPAEEVAATLGVTVTRAPPRRSCRRRRSVGGGRPHLGPKSALGRAARDLAQIWTRRWLRCARPRGGRRRRPCLRDPRGSDRDAVVAETSGRQR